MRVGIDIDGVLFPWDEAANEALMERFGIPDPGPHRYWNWLEDRVTPEQWAWLWSAEGQDVVFSQVARVYASAVSSFNAILKNPANRVHFVTHRDPRRTALWTAEFLQHHFGGHPWAGLHVLQNAVPKHTLAEWDVFIDDKVETVLAMLEHTRAQVFVPARPWNEELANPLWPGSWAWHRYGAPRLIRYDDPAVVAEWVALHG